MMRSIVFLILCVIMMSGCAVKKETLNTEPKKFETLTQDIKALGKGVDEKEAKMFAKEALSYPRVLAEKYKLMAPANFQNMLINMGMRERGLCYEWTEDMITHLKKQNYRSFDLRWGVAFKGEPMEHNSVVLVAKALLLIAVYSSILGVILESFIGGKWKMISSLNGLKI